jgi:hypothetical protein
VVAEGLRSDVAETRQHFDVVAESIRADVRLVSEGVASNGERIEQFRGEVRGEFEATKAMIRSLLQ